MQYTLDWMDWAYHRNSEMLRCSIHVQTYLCGLAVVLPTVQFSETSHCYFGLIGLCGTAGVPTVPCWCCLRKEKQFPQFWPSDVSWWRMGVSGPLRWRKLPGCMLIVVGSSLSLGDGEWSLYYFLCCDVISLWVHRPHLIPSPSASLVSLDKVKKPQDRHQQGKRVHIASGTPDQSPVLVLSGPTWCLRHGSHSYRRGRGLPGMLSVPSLSLGNTQSWSPLSFNRRM